MKRVIALMFAALMMISFCACGGGSTDDVLGIYECVEQDWGTFTADPAGEWIQLDKGGEGTLYIGYEYPIEWKLKGENLTIELVGFGDPYQSTLVEDEIVFDFDGTIYTFVKNTVASAGDTQAESEGAEETIEQTDLQAYWNGDWYGWWIIDTGFGEYESLGDGNHWYDCCATIQIDEEGYGYIEIWDEDGANDSLMVSAQISVSYGVTDNGCMTSESGFFYDNDIEHADWIIDPGASDVSDYDHMICIDGEYIDPENDENSYYYYIYLRPWGMTWDGVSDYYMPCYYYSWYLPLIEAGADMPDYFELSDDYEDSEDESALDDADTSGDESYDNSDEWQIGIQGDDGPPEGAPAGGDGVTTMTYDALLAKSDGMFAEYTYDGVKSLAYEDIVNIMDGVEGEYEDDGLDDYWSYNWYGTDGSRWNAMFYADTGLFYTCAIYAF